MDVVGHAITAHTRRTRLYYYKIAELGTSKLATYSRYLAFPLISSNHNQFVHFYYLLTMTLFPGV